MKNIFLKTSVTTDIIPLNVSDLNSVTRAIKWNLGRLSLSEVGMGLSLHFWICVAQWAQWAQQSHFEGECQAQGDPKPCSPQGFTAKEGHLSLVRPQLGAQGKHEEQCNNFGFTPVLLKAEFGPARRQGDKNIHLTYLPLEWTRQISILKGIAFKSSMDFENNIIARYHKQFPIFRSSWARLSFSSSSNNSIKAVREMELQWTGIHFP